MNNNFNLDIEELHTLAYANGEDIFFDAKNSGLWIMINDKLWSFKKEKILSI
jgi:hypothetical protein